MRAFREFKSVGPGGETVVQQLFSPVYDALASDNDLYRKAVAIGGGMRALIAPSIYAPAGSRVYSTPTHFDHASGSSNTIAVNADVVFSQDVFGSVFNVDAGAFGGETLSSFEYRVTGQGQDWQPWPGSLAFVAGEGAVQLRALFGPKYDENDSESPFAGLPGDKPGIPLGKVDFTTISIKAYDAQTIKPMVSVFPTNGYGRMVPSGNKFLNFLDTYSYSSYIWGDQKFLVMIEKGATARVRSRPARNRQTGRWFSLNQTISVQALDEEGSPVGSTTASGGVGRSPNDEGVIEIPLGGVEHFTRTNDGGAAFLIISAKPKLPVKPYRYIYYAAPFEVTPVSQATVET